MQATQEIWQNGKFVSWDDAKIHVLSHTLHYGGGAFEGIRFYKTEKGPAIFRLEEHVDRLFYSANALKIVIPYTPHEIISAIKETVKKSKLESGYIRPIAFYGLGGLRVNPIGNPVECVIACWPWGAYLPHEAVDVKTSSYIRIHPDSTIVDAKLCGHYVNGILASLELHGTHYHEALFLDSNGYVTEGVGENFFMIKSGVVYTPKLGGILSGLTRDAIIKLLDKLNYKVVEADITLEEAYQADEAFFTGTAAEVTIIRSIDDKVLGDGIVGELTAKIKKSYLDIVHGREAEFENYLTYL